jgi:hypothetical protein
MRIRPDQFVCMYNPTLIESGERREATTRGCKLVVIVCTCRQAITHQFDVLILWRALHEVCHPATTAIAAAAISIVVRSEPVEPT